MRKNRIKLSSTTLQFIKFSIFTFHYKFNNHKMRYDFSVIFSFLKFMYLFGSMILLTIIFAMSFHSTYFQCLPVKKLLQHSYSHIIQSNLSAKINISLSLSFNKLIRCVDDEINKKIICMRTEYVKEALFLTFSLSRFDYFSVLFHFI